MDVSFIVVSYNVQASLRSCLRSVLAATADSGLHTEIAVVDNASADGSAAMVESDFGDVTLLMNIENEGYGAACNRGSGVSAGEVLIFLNADAELTGRALRELHASLTGEDRVGLAGPAIVDADGSPHRSVRRFPSPGTWLLDGTIFERWRMTRWLLASYRPAVVTGPPILVDWVEGACLAVRRDAFDSVAGFDRGYFMYCEELDLCRRLCDGGWSVAYVPGAVVTHQGGASARQARALNRARFLRSKVRYAGRTWSGAMAVTAASFYVFALGVELTLELAKMLVPIGDRHGRRRAARTLVRTVALFVGGGLRGE